jgi:hypothetical protein
LTIPAKFIQPIQYYAGVLPFMPACKATLAGVKGSLNSTVNDNQIAVFAEATTGRSLRKYGLARACFTEYN